MAVITLLRFGLTGVSAFRLVHRLVLLFPTTVDPSAWYIGVSLFTLTAILALAGFGCFIAVARTVRLPRAA
ncbi:MAG TPA: hypothetical protein VKE51_29560 [Vicinamibacterales bacterium]|nr:hypothetical protein [Vicinamibacterales bacterium]